MSASYHRDKLREELISEGRHLLILDGFEAFSLRKLAKLLGVSHAAPYRHFASREELLAAIVREDEERFTQALIKSAQDIPDPLERLYCLGEAYILFFTDNPETLLLFTVLKEKLSDQAGLLSQSIFPTVTIPFSTQDENCRADQGYQLLKEAVAPLCSLHPGLSEREVILGYWAKVHGIAALIIGNPGFLPEETLKESIRKLVRSPF